MCGIVCAFDLKESTETLRPQLLEMSKKVRHRGQTGCVCAVPRSARDQDLEWEVSELGWSNGASCNRAIATVAISLLAVELLFEMKSDYMGLLQNSSLMLSSHRQ